MATEPICESKIERLNIVPLHGPVAPGPISGPESVTKTSKNDATEKLCISSFIVAELSAVTPTGVVRSPVAVPDTVLATPKVPSVIGLKTCTDTVAGDCAIVGLTLIST